MSSADVAAVVAELSAGPMSIIEDREDLPACK